MTRTIQTLLANIIREGKRASRDIPGLTRQERLDIRNALVNATTIIRIAQVRSWKRP